EQGLPSLRPVVRSDGLPVGDAFLRVPEVGVGAQLGGGGAGAGGERLPGEEGADLAIVGGEVERELAAVEAAEGGRVEGAAVGGDAVAQERLAVEGVELLDLLLGSRPPVVAEGGASGG